MKQVEKDAVAAVIVRLFDKENSVNISKFEELAKLSKKYKLNANDTQEARSAMLEDAVSTLVKSPKICNDLVSDLVSLAKSDGLYTPDEFLLLRSLEYALSGKAQIVTIPVQKLQLSGRVAMFVQVQGEDMGLRKLRNLEVYISKSQGGLSKICRAHGVELILASQLAQDYSSPEMRDHLKGFSYYLSHFEHHYICQAIDQFERFSAVILGDIFRALHPIGMNPGSYFLIKTGSSYIGITGQDHALQQCHNFVLLPVPEAKETEAASAAKKVLSDFFETCDVAAVKPLPEGRIPHFDFYKSIISCQLIMGIGKTDSDITICPYDRIVIFNDIKDVNGQPKLLNLNSRMVEYLFTVWQTLYEKELKKVDHEYAVMTLNYIVQKLNGKENPYEVSRSKSVEWLNEQEELKEKNTLSVSSFRENARKIDRCLLRATAYTPYPESYSTYAIPISSRRKSTHGAEFSTPHHYRIKEIRRKVFVATTTKRTISLSAQNYYAAVNNILKNRVELKGSDWGEKLLEFAKESNE